MTESTNRADALQVLLPITGRDARHVVRELKDSRRIGIFMALRVRGYDVHTALMQAYDHTAFGLPRYVLEDAKVQESRFITRVMQYDLAEDNTKAKRPRWQLVLAALIATIAIVGVVTVIADQADGHETAPLLSPEGAHWLRHCESTNRYGLVHLDVDDEWVYGAYQFKWPTWQEAVAGTEWEAWSGTLPSNVPPDIQDAVAKSYWDRGFHRKWSCHYAAIDAMNQGVAIPDNQPPAETDPVLAPQKFTGLIIIGL